MSSTLASRDLRDRQHETIRALDDIVGRAERFGLRVLSPEEVEQLPRLYRQARSALDHARDTRLDRNLIDKLDELTTRTALLLRRPQTGFLRWLLRGLFIDLPALYWRELRYMALGLGITLLGAILGYYAVHRYPELQYTLIPERIRSLTLQPSNPLQWITEAAGSIDRMFGGRIDNLQLALITVTWKACFFAFLFGFAFGVPSLFIAFGFGTMAGAIVAFEQISREIIWGEASVVTCTALMILSVGLCASAGVIMGTGLWRPAGGQARSIRERSSTSIALLALGVAFFIPFVIAALQSHPFVPQVVRTEWLFHIPLALWALTLVWGAIAERVERRLQ